MTSFGIWVSGFGFEFRASNFRFRVEGFRFWVSGFGFQISGFELQVSGLGVMVGAEQAGYITYFSLHSLDRIWEKGLFRDRHMHPDPSRGEPDFPEAVISSGVPRS